MESWVRRGSFIGRCLEVQEAFQLMTPDNTLGAVTFTGGQSCGNPADELLGGHSQGCVGSSHTHRVLTRWLSGHHSSFKEDLLTPWVRFYQSLLNSQCTELAVIARVAAEDLRSTTGAHNWLIYVHQHRPGCQECQIRPVPQRAEEEGGGHDGRGAA